MGSLIAVKKVAKRVNQQKTVSQDGMTMLVEEDLIKESVILKHLTMDNSNKYVVKFVDFFESERDLYLCTEFVEGMNLRQFVTAAHSFISEGRLSLKEYRKR